MHGSQKQQHLRAVHVKISGDSWWTKVMYSNFNTVQWETVAEQIVSDQLQEFTSLPLTMASSGFDNALIKVGSEHALRLPKSERGAQLLLTEQKWLPWIASQLTLSVPVPLRLGSPTKTFKYPWSLVRWLPGDAADVATSSADDLSCIVKFLRELHAIEKPESAPANRTRDCLLRMNPHNIEQRIQSVSARTDLVTSQVMDVWKRALVEEIDVETSWIFGDLHAGNILIHNKKVSSVIDWGNVCIGDPATDLAAIWLFSADQSTRENAITEYGASNSTVTRAKGWAIFFAVVLSDAGFRLQNNRARTIGEHALTEISSCG